MAKVYKKMTPSRFFCTNCGMEGLPIMRPKGNRREKGHLKKLYCLHCKKEVNHMEIRNIDINGVEQFKQEYNLGRFVNGNRIEIKDLLDCSCNSCPFNVNGKCWNSNWSNDCGHRVKEVDVNE